MRRWRLIGSVLTAIGLVDALYLFVNSLFPNIPLACPSSGVINCAAVTSSSFSKFAGLSVAGLGFAFFVVMLAIFLVGNETLNYLLLPLWAVGAIFVGYLVYAELFVLGEICMYCTVDHVIALVLVLPAIKVALGEET